VVHEVIQKKNLSGKSSSHKEKCIVEETKALLDAFGHNCIKIEGTNNGKQP